MRSAQVPRPEPPKTARSDRLTFENDPRHGLTPHLAAP